MKDELKKSIEQIKEIATKIATDPQYVKALEDEIKKSGHQPHPGATSVVPGYEKSKQSEAEKKLKTPEGEAERQKGNAARFPGLKAMMAKSDEHLAKLKKDAFGGNPNKAHAAAKGVHKPVLSPNSGKSAMGVVSNPAQKKALANQVVKEQAAMKKPSLPKAELEKARIDDGQSDAQKRMARRPDAGHRSGGVATFDASQGPKIKGGHVAAAKESAKGTLQRIQAAPKPNLGKEDPAAAPVMAPAAPQRSMRDLLKESDGWMKKCSMMKKDNPDAAADAELGENVENLVENHMIANKEAEQQEGHEIAPKE